MRSVGPAVASSAGSEELLASADSLLGFLVTARATGLHARPLGDVRAKLHVASGVADSRLVVGDVATRPLRPRATGLHARLAGDVRAGLHIPRASTSSAARGVRLAVPGVTAVRSFVPCPSFDALALAFAFTSSVK